MAIPADFTLRRDEHAVYTLVAGEVSFPGKLFVATAKLTPTFWGVDSGDFPAVGESEFQRDRDVSF
jgi:hypothetical protein